MPAFLSAKWKVFCRSTYMRTISDLPWTFLGKATRRSSEDIFQNHQFHIAVASISLTLSIILYKRADTDAKELIFLSFLNRYELSINGTNKKAACLDAFNKLGQSLHLVLSGEHSWLRASVSSCSPKKRWEKKISCRSLLFLCHCVLFAERFVRLLPWSSATHVFRSPKIRIRCKVLGFSLCWSNGDDHKAELSPGGVNNENPKSWAKHER